MKYLILILTLFVTLSCCKKDDANDPLPPATQTGAGTFACKVNGQNFIDTSGGYFNCFYQFNDGEYYFGIQGKDEEKSMRTVVLSTTAKSISEGETLLLLENIDGNAWGGGRFNTETIGGDASYTNSQYTGELTITKLDFINNIVSGTFWFDIEHPVTGETVETREGRFDTLFTQ